MDHYHRAYNSLVRMLQHRKYQLPDGNTDLSSLELSYEDFKAKYDGIQQGALDITEVRRSDGLPVYVRFLNKPLTEVKATKDFFKNDLGVVFERHLPEVSVDRSKVSVLSDLLKECYVIVVYVSELKKGFHLVSPIERSLVYGAKLGELVQNRIQFFATNRLTIDLLNAAIMPKFELLTPEQASALTFNRNKSNQFTLTDPVVKYFGAKPGDIFKITRATSNGTNEVCWRMVNRMITEPMKGAKDKS